MSFRRSTSTWFCSHSHMTFLSLPQWTSRESSCDLVYLQPQVGTEIEIESLISLKNSRNKLIWMLFSSSLSCPTAHVWTELRSVLLQSHVGGEQAERSLHRQVQATHNATCSPIFTWEKLFTPVALLTCCQVTSSTVSWSTTFLLLQSHIFLPLKLKNQEININLMFLCFWFHHFLFLCVNLIFIFKRFPHQVFFKRASASEGPLASIC